MQYERRPVIRTADALYMDASVDDATWETLVAHHGERQILDVIFMVSNYLMLAMALNAFGVQLDEGYHGFRPGLPVNDLRPSTTLPPMGVRRATPRLAPLSDAALTRDQRELLTKVRGHLASVNVLDTVIRHPDLLRCWLPFFNHALHKSTLPARDREVLILRTERLCGAEYEWAQHVPFAERAGLTAGEYHLAFRARPPGGRRLPLVQVVTPELRPHVLGHDLSLGRAEHRAHVQHRPGDDISDPAMLLVALRPQLVELREVDLVGLEERQGLVDRRAPVLEVPLHGREGSIAGAVDQCALLRPRLGLVEHLVDHRLDHPLHDGQPVSVTRADIGAVRCGHRCRLCDRPPVHHEDPPFTRGLPAGRHRRGPRRPPSMPSPGRVGPAEPAREGRSRRTSFFPTGP